jgi:hypothetical protein
MYDFILPVFSLGASSSALILWKSRVYLSPLFVRRIDEAEIAIINGYHILFYKNDIRQEVILSIVAVVICIAISMYILLNIISLMQSETTTTLAYKLILIAIALICTLNTIFALYMVLFLILMTLIGIGAIFMLHLVIISSGKSVHVRGHYRNGAYVRSHYRNRPRR